MRKLNIWISQLFLLLYLGGALPAPAAAQTKPPPSPELSLDPKAEELYRKGVALYKNEQYAEAVVAFESAYRISQAPRLLYNLGQVHRKLRHTQDSIDYYDEYLRREPSIEPERRAAVQGYIRELQAQLPPKPEDHVAAPLPPPPPREKQPLYRKWWLWTSIGGVVVTGAAIGLAVGLQPHHSQLTNYYDPIF